MYGIQTDDGELWQPGPLGRPAKTDRNNEICRRYQGGVSSVALAAEYGVSRERICQILRRANLIEKKAQRARLVRETEAEAAAEARVQVERQIARACELVRNGSTHLDAALATGVSRVVVAYNCKKRGIKSKNGRHQDFSEREARVRAMRAEGKTFAEIIQTLRLEGDLIQPNWIHNNLPDLVTPHSRKLASAILPTAPRAAKPPTPKPEDIWTDDKVAALKQHWRSGCSAQQISDIFGPPFTRNAIIGKVHRLRSAGKLFE
jgi:hypothetical protein